MFTKRFDRKVYLLAGVFVLSALVGVTFGVYALWPANLEAGFEPEQPIPYSHRLHAGTLKIDCRYCHWNVETGAHAALPSVAICMNCHAQVQPKGIDGELKPAIATLVIHAAKGEPILWEKVHVLADFVYFHHGSHIAAGIECRECHGRVEGMEHVRTVHGLVMRWCLDCHRQPAADAAGGAESGARRTRGSDQCVVCHR